MWSRATGSGSLARGLADVNVPKMPCSPGASFAMITREGRRMAEAANTKMASFLQPDLKLAGPMLRAVGVVCLLAKRRSASLLDGAVVT